MESVFLFILGVAIIAVGIVVSIALHEIGHLIPAKAFGVKVTQYMVGFGKTVFSVKRGETEYGVKAIPAGGYIAMIGMFPPKKGESAARNASTGFFNTLVQDARASSAETVGAGEENRTFYRLPVYKRIIVMLGGPVMNLIIGVVLFAVLLCGVGMQVSTVGALSQCVLPAGTTQQACEPTDPVPPAAAAGFEPGDRIIRINGESTPTWAETTQVFQNSAGEALDVVVMRDGEEALVQVTPMTATRTVLDKSGMPVIGADGEPVTHTIGFVGIIRGHAYVPQPIGEVFPMVGDQLAAITNVVVSLPSRMVDIWNAAFSSAPRDPNGPISVVGVGRLAGEVASLESVPVLDRAYYLTSLLAAVNLALFIFNLIPLLPLDGGHIAGALWEAIRRGAAKVFRRKDPGPVDIAKLMPLTFGVVVALGAMSILLVYADIVKPISIVGS